MIPSWAHDVKPEDITNATMLDLAELLGTVYFAAALKHLYRTEIRRLDILEENAF